MKAVEVVVPYFPRGICTAGGGIREARRGSMGTHIGGTVMTGKSHSKQGVDSAITRDASGSGSPASADDSQQANVQANWNSGHPGGVAATNRLPDSAVSLDDAAEISAGSSSQSSVAPHANLRGQLKWNEQLGGGATWEGSEAINDVDRRR